MPPKAKVRAYHSLSKRSRAELSSSLGFLSSINSPRRTSKPDVAYTPDRDAEQIGSAFNSPERSNQWSARMPSPPAITFTLLDSDPNLVSFPVIVPSKPGSSIGSGPRVGPKVGRPQKSGASARGWRFESEVRARWRARLRQWRAESKVPLWQILVFGAILIICGRFLLKSRDLEQGQQSSGLSSTLPRQSAAGQHQPSIEKRDTTPTPPRVKAAPDVDDAHYPSGLQSIPKLIEAAQYEWNTKLASQSTTLVQAVDEYRRRYKQNPPNGFDQWWKYVIDNNIALPDEYDQIYKDIRPFMGLDKVNLLGSRLDIASARHDTYTLKIEDGLVEVEARMFDPAAQPLAEERLQAQVKQLGSISHLLTNFRAVFSIHDTPSVFISNLHRDELEECAAIGECVDMDLVDESMMGYPYACPLASRLAASHRANSQLRHHGDRHPTAMTRTQTLIASHSTAMDLCDNPEYLKLHGSLSTSNPRSGLLMPIFSISKTTAHADVLAVPYENWMSGDLTSSMWVDKTNNRALWRGSITGGHWSVDVPWRQSQRMRLVKLARTSGEKTGHPNNIRKTISEGSDDRDAKDDYFDFAFTGSPLQCEEGDGTCTQMAEEYTWTSKRMTQAQMASYKFLVDVDGNGWSSRFLRLMSMGSVVLKSTIMPEWWTDRIQPWVHYVPIRIDYSDMLPILSHFRSTKPEPTSNQTGDAQAEQIARAGAEWAATHHRYEDMVAYMFRLYLEWARLQAPHGTRRDFII